MQQTFTPYRTSSGSPRSICKRSAMAVATPLLSAAARRCTRSASTIGRREVMDCHSLTIDGCTTFRKIPKTWFSTSESFVAAGHIWRIRFYPKGECCFWRQGYMSLYLELVTAANAYYRATDPVDFKFTLLDLAGNPVPQYSRAMAAHVFSAESRRVGFNDFIRWKDLERSGCLKDDRFTVRCDITVFQDYWTAGNDGDGGGHAVAPVQQVTVPPSNLHEHLGDLLGKKQGADVTVDVAGEAFDAHGWLLGARSPVFEAELLAAAKEKAPSGGRRRVVVEGMDPKVFKAMLHFMYTDVLPEMDQEDTVDMSLGLLAAAHRYELERLKLICEETLCRRIDVDTAASSLAVAEQHGCRALKAACLGFMARPGNLKAVMETKGFEKIKANCPAVMLDLIMKQVAARMAIHQP